MGASCSYEVGSQQGKWRLKIVYFGWSALEGGKFSFTDTSRAGVLEIPKTSGYDSDNKRCNGIFQLMSYLDFLSCINSNYSDYAVIMEYRVLVVPSEYNRQVICRISPMRG
jgi:hypothetical protein